LGGGRLWGGKVDGFGMLCTFKRLATEVDGLVARFYGRADLNSNTGGRLQA